MDSGAGSCHMASTFYEIFRESGLQRQLENGWGGYSDGTAVGSASAPSADFDRSQSRQSPKASSPSGSRKHQEGESVKSRKSKKPRGGRIKEENEEEGGMRAIPAAQESSNPYSPKRDSQATESGDGASGYKLNGEGYGGREYLSGLDTELDTLRKHILQRANAPRSFP